MTGGRTVEACSLAADLARSQREANPPYSSMNVNVDGEGKSVVSETSSTADGGGGGVDSLAHPPTRPRSFLLSTDRLSKLAVQAYR